MKAIIIDDETHVREGVLLLAEWNRFGIHEIFEAKDGEEAKTVIIQHQPEIIFTDMNMPRFDGIELLKWLSEKEIDSKIIVISGYDDFHYMRNAITYGSFDYLLKPIDPIMLNETIERAISELKKQALKKESTLETARVINEVKPLYWDRIFSNTMMNPEQTTEKVQKIEKEFGINIQRAECTIALIYVHSKIVKHFDGDKNLAFFTLLNICNEIVRKNQSGFCFRNENVEDELVILLWNNKYKMETLENISREIYRFIKMNPLISVGSISRMKEAYKTAKITLLKHTLINPKKRNNLINYQDLVSGSSFHLLDFAEDIKWATQSGSIEQMDEITEKLFSILESKHVVSLEQVRAWDDQFDLLRINWLKEYNINENVSFYSGKDYWDKEGVFSFQKFKEEKKKEFIELIHLLHDVKYQKRGSSIQEIEEYLRKNYEKDITLQDIAERFFLSREYICRKFKQEYNETITNYLTTIRIEKAKELLENPYLKIYEIAFNVGYQNEKYFSKVFKKMVGLTPNEFRAKVITKPK